MKILKSIILILTTIICTSCLSSPAFAYTIQGKVAYVYDGDTIKLKVENQYHRIRLASIDSPEKDQPYGIESTLLLRKLIQNKTVLANIIDTDKYGRKIAYIQLVTPQALRASPPNRGALADISSIMLANGAAWHYKAFDKTSAQYDIHYALEEQAKSNKQGLWAQTNPIAPWVWRKKTNENMKTRTIQT